MGHAAILWLAAILALGAAPVQAQLTPPALPPTPPPAPPGPVLKCTISGYDVVLTNTGPETLARGTRLAWRVPYARVEGTHELDRDLGPGATVFMTAALGSNYLRPTVPCEAEVIAGG